LIKNKNIFLIVTKINFLRAESVGMSSHQKAAKDDKMWEENNLSKILADTCYMLEFSHVQLRLFLTMIIKYLGDKKNSRDNAKRSEIRRKIGV
jgi:hypothetical protein